MHENQYQRARPRVHGPTSVEHGPPRPRRAPRNNHAFSSEHGRRDRESDRSFSHKSSSGVRAMTGKRTGNPGDGRRGLLTPRFPSISGYRFLQTIARSAKSEVHVAYSVELGENV